MTKQASIWSKDEANNGGRTVDRFAARGLFSRKLAKREEKSTVYQLGLRNSIKNHGRTTGFEPANKGVTILCLTTWRRPPLNSFKLLPAKKLAAHENVRESLHISTPSACRK